MATRHMKGIPSALDYPFSDLEKLNLKCVESTAVEYDDTSEAIFTVPANTLIVAAVYVVDTGFDVASSISLGDGTTAAKYGKWTGSLRTAGAYGKWVFVEEASRVTMTATVSASGAAAGTGRFFIVYRSNSNEQNYIK